MAEQPQERYSHGYGVAQEGLSRRTAFTHAQFFLPHLQSGMSLLDCGCGPGSTTATFAKDVVAPGEVVGIDIGEESIERARQHAATKNVLNVRFEVASIYELPFPDDSFDAAFAHTVLQHLGEPVRALKEMFRVLKPGGVVGLREEDQGSRIMSPDNSVIQQAFELYMKYWQNNGGDPYFARRHKEVLREADFENIAASISHSVYSSPEETKARADSVAGHWAEPVFADRVVEMGWATRDELDEMIAAFTTWGENPDAIFTMTMFEAVGFKPSTNQEG